MLRCFLNFPRRIRIIIVRFADVAELVDARVSEARGHCARDGSIPFVRTNFWKKAADHWRLYLFRPFMRDQFLSALTTNAPAFDMNIGEAESERLLHFYEIVQRENPLLHLVAPSGVEEFVVRHILESLYLLRFLPENARLVDVGPGAGLPSVPCVLVRDDISAVLIESKEKKARYLENAANELGISERVTVVNRQFEETRPDADLITCRALDKFTQKLPRLLKWGKGAKMLLFGGEALAAELEKHGVNAKAVLLPMSERRFLFLF